MSAQSRIYKAYSEIDKQKFDLYVLSTVNAFYIGTLSLIKVSQWLGGDGIHPSFTISMLVSISGYFIHDFFASRTQWLKQKDNVLHHLAAIVICLSVTYDVDNNQDLLKFVPLFGLAELSTIFLNAGWMLRKVSAPSSYIQITDYLFALVFFATRILIFPYAVFDMIFLEKVLFITAPRTVLGVGLCIASGLQFFWLQKILAMLKKSYKEGKVAKGRD